VHLRFRDVRRSEGCPHWCLTIRTVRAAFLVSATFTGRGPLGSPASSTGSTVKRLLPFAAAPAAIAGVAAAFAFGNSSGGAPAVADAVVHPPTATAVTPKADVSGGHVLSITQESATGVPIVRLNASRLAAIEPKGKHHRTPSAKYAVKSGDTLASIAAHLYHSADYWPVLYWANHGEIKYANEITAGQVLTVPAKPAKIPAAPKTVAPVAAPVAAPAASSASYGASSQAVSQTQAAPVQTASTSTAGDSSFQACVIAAESGGNSQVMNSSGHYGLYQFSASTWAAYGGNPADFGNASAAEQNQVFDNAIAAGGQSNWAPYDGC
jgi:LysM repeat protein